MDGLNHHMEDKREGQKKSKDTQPTWTKEGRELVPLVVGSYLTHSPSDVTHKLKIARICIYD
jgi:hypothetical protein